MQVNLTWRITPPAPSPACTRFNLLETLPSSHFKLTATQRRAIRQLRWMCTTPRAQRSEYNDQCLIRTHVSSIDKMFMGLNSFILVA